MLEIDIHGYAYHTITSTDFLSYLIRQAWEMGARELAIIHGHGLWRGLRRPFANTNTGVLGLAVRSELRHNKDLRKWIFAHVNVSDPGVTYVRIRENPTPSRNEFDGSQFPERDYERR